MGIAYVTAPVQAAWQVFPGNVRRPMTKYTMYGALAEAGVNAVLLAKGGFTGNYDVLEPEQQYWRGLGAIGCDYDELTDRLRERWFITETAFKVYPFGRQANIPIDLLLQIASDNGLSRDDIDTVTIRMPPSSITDELRRPPADDPTQLDASFNLRHALAAAISGLTPGPQWLSPRAVSDPDLRAFQDKIGVEPKPEWRAELEAQLREDGWFARIPTEVEVTAGGRTFTAAAEYAKGDPWTPETTVTDDEIIAKFVEYTRHAIGRQRADEAVERVFGLDTALGVEPLLGALAR
jgi:2-methylcitrate dehydratase PrpD